MEVQCAEETRGYRCQRWFVPNGSTRCPYHREIKRAACERFRGSEKFKRSKKKYCQSTHGKAQMSKEQAIRYARGKIAYRLTTEMGNVLAGRRNYTCMITHTSFESTEEFREHISSTWAEGMNWSNFGQGADKWSVGHKIPKSKYDFDNPEDVRRCWSKQNVAAQWWADNKAQSSSLPSQAVLDGLKLAAVDPVGWA